MSGGLKQPKAAQDDHGRGVKMAFRNWHDRLYRMAANRKRGYRR